MEENKILIHIGMHKTGTTYIQNYFFNSLENVEIVSHPQFYQNISKKKMSDSDWFLISNEGISGVAWNYNWLIGEKNKFCWIDSFHNGIDKIKLLFPEAIILIFFRKHGDLLISMYKQYLHEGGVLKIEDFYGENKVISEKDLSISTRINKLKDEFKDVYFLSYEDYKEFGDKYLIDFFGSFGIRYNSTKTKIHFRNESISGKKMELLRNVNKFYIRLPLKLRKAMRRLRISPRDIFQKHLSFWKTRDSDNIISLKNQINKDFEIDWRFFQENKWGIR